MKCIYCQGTMKKGKTSYHVDRKGYHLLLDEMPAWLCDQCGEAYFEETEVDTIQHLIRAIDQEVSQLPKSA